MNASLAATGITGTTTATTSTTAPLTTAAIFCLIYNYQGRVLDAIMLV